MMITGSQPAAQSCFFLRCYFFIVKRFFSIERNWDNWTLLNKALVTPESFTTSDGSTHGWVWLRGIEGIVENEIKAELEITIESLLFLVKLFLHRAASRRNAIWIFNERLTAEAQSEPQPRCLAVKSASNKLQAINTQVFEWDCTFSETNRQTAQFSPFQHLMSFCRRRNCSGSQNWRERNYRSNAVHELDDQKAENEKYFFLTRLSRGVLAQVFTQLLFTGKKARFREGSSSGLIWRLRNVWISSNFVQFQIGFW